MSILTRAPVIWALFLAAIAISAGFQFFGPSVGGVYLDLQSTGVASRILIDGLTDAQRSAHFRVTVLLDTAYPLAYGGFFAAMALRFFGKAGPVLALPALATVVADLGENTVQALALAGAADLLDVKDWLTPLKFGLFALAGAIAFVALVVATFKLGRRLAKRSAD